MIYKNRNNYKINNHNKFSIFKILVGFTTRDTIKKDVTAFVFPSNKKKSIYEGIFMMSSEKKKTRVQIYSVCKYQNSDPHSIRYYRLCMITIHVIHYVFYSHRLLKET